jgi:phosphatidylglycerophosphatase C
VVILRRNRFWPFKFNYIKPIALSYKQTTFPTEPLSQPDRTLVLFDFDGTLTTGDSWVRFMWFALGFWGILAALPGALFGLLLLVLNGSFSAAHAKEVFMAACFKGRSEAELRQLGSDFVGQKLPGFIRPQVLEGLRLFRDQGCTVALVSASIDIWLQPFCTQENIQLLCTELAFSNGVFTGRFAMPNCKYEEKARRIRAAFALMDFDLVLAYGNSAGDYAMFDLADRAWEVDKSGHFRGKIV